MVSCATTAHLVGVSDPAFHQGPKVLNWEPLRFVVLEDIVTASDDVS